MHKLKPEGSGKGSMVSGHGSRFKSLLGENVIVRDSKSSGKNQYDKNGM